jgi:hypothetical protein
VSRLPRYAVVPSNGRPFLDDLLASLVGQADEILVVANNWQRQEGAHVLRRNGAPIGVLIGPDERNISRWWNLGLDAFAERAHSCGEPEWDVLVVNDDVVCPASLIDTLSSRMRTTTAVLAYPDQAGGWEEILHTEPEPVPLNQRITGYAFLLRGEAGLRADEDLVWWAGDDALDWSARQQGGALLVPGVPVQHRAPDVQTNADAELTAQAGGDMGTFVAKWGARPW